MHASLEEFTSPASLVAYLNDQGGDLDRKDRIYNVLVEAVQRRARVESLHARLGNPPVILDATGVGKAAVELFRSSNFNLYVFTLMAGDQMIQDGSSYRIPKRDVISTTQVLLQTGRLKIARSLPHASLLARELVNFRFKVTSKGSENALDWREGPDDDLVLALAIAAWQAERNPGLGFSCGYAVSEMSGLGSL
jgi:hypothetical protein